MKNVKFLSMSIAAILVSFIILSNIAASSSILPSTSLEGYWNMDSDASDSSGNELHGTIVGDVSLTSGKFENAYSFGGYNDYIEIPDSQLLDLSNELTISTWVNHSSTPLKSWETILAKGDNSYRLHLCGFGFCGAGNDSSFAFGANGLSVSNLSSNVIPEANTWYNIVTTYDGATIKIYVNGVLKNSANVTGSIQTNNYGLGIAYNNEKFQENRYWNGLIDDVAIWNRALTQTEITALYNDTTVSAFCGDESCNGTEDCSNCEADCGECQVAETCYDYTSDNLVNIFDLVFIGSRIASGQYNISNLFDVVNNFGVCQGTETCGDAQCTGTETCSTCEQDCGECPTEIVCGNDSCESGETCSSCPQDCGDCGGAFPMGLNVGQIRYYSTFAPFLNIMKQCETWKVPDQTFDWGNYQGTIDENGYPSNGVPSNGVYCNGPFYPSGNFTVFYEGNGELRIAGQTVTNGDTVNLSGGAFTIQILSSSNSPNHLRNIAIVKSGYESTYLQEIWDPDFLVTFPENTHTIRFMRMQWTNDQQIVNWNERTTPTFVTQDNSHGPAVEYMIDLSNKVGANPWFSIPAKANDDYVRNFAQTIKDTLDPNLNVYVEYSNELWNVFGYPFTQGEWVKNKGCEVFLGQPSCSDWTYRERYQAYRSGQIFQIFNEVFAGQEHRVIKVVAGQSANSDILNRVMDSMENPTYNPSGIMPNAIAIAPYIEGDENLDLDSLFDQMRNGNQWVGLAGARYGIQNHKSIANEYNVDLIAYEGGQHLVGGTNSIPANRDSRMGDVYRAYFNMWSEEGGGLFAHYHHIYSPSASSGCWGLMENQDDFENYKLAPVIEKMNAWAALNS